MTKDKFKTIPQYIGGLQNDSLYLAGYGIKDKSFLPEDESLMKIICETTEEEFETYLSVLEAEGFEKLYSHRSDGNIYSAFAFGEDFLYTYFTPSTSEVRIILDNHSEVSPENFGYSYSKKSDEHTVLYQYGLPMNEAGLNIVMNDEKKIDCGMMYVMKLADNSLLIIDGAAEHQFDEEAVDAFMAYLERITGIHKDGKIRIFGWFITHGHHDHFAGFCLFLAKYSERITVERIFCNLMSPNTDHARVKANTYAYEKLTDYINKYLAKDSPVFMKVHTGEVFPLADAKISVLYTHEDIVKPENCTTGIGNDYNNTSTVLMIEFDGKRFLVLGDISRRASAIIIRNNSQETLGCDVVQMAHHVINDLPELYRISKASVLFIPQSPKGCLTSPARRTSLGVAIDYISPGMLFYASKETVGLEVIGEKLTPVYKDKVYGGPFTGWTW